MTKKKKSLALIGTGQWGQNLARNFNSLGVLHTLCDVNKDALAPYRDGYEDVHKTNSVEEVLENREITEVAIAAPAVFHFQLAKDALQAGKDVFVEKPLCLDEEGGRELVECAQRRERILMVGHLLQYHPCVRKLRSLIAQGELGKLFYVTSNRLNLGRIRREENSLWSFAPHDISVILSLAGELPESVRSTGEAYLNFGIADTTLTMLRFVSGLRAHVYVSWLNPFKEQKLTIVGSQGLAVFDDTKPWKEKLIIHRQYLNWFDGQTPLPCKRDAERVEVEESEPLQNECLHFLDCCRQRTRPETDGIEGLRVLKVLRAAQQSLDGDGEAVVVKRRANGQTSMSPECFTHPTAIIDDGAAIGKGTKIWHFVHISKGARIGENCIFGQNTFVAPDVVIGNNVKVQNNVAIYSGAQIDDDVFLGPSCVLTNITNPRSQINRKSQYKKTTIKKGATIGANATIVCGVTLGSYCFIAAGAVVTKDVPDYALMVESPARQQGWMSRHGHRLENVNGGAMVCPESGYRYKEVSPGVLRCLDLDESAPLPS